VTKTKKIGYRWHLRQLMAQKDMFSTTDLQPLLEQRGIHLSPAQVYRLVVQTPERLNLNTLAALCDILDCSPNELVEPVVFAQRAKKAVAKDSGAKRSRELTPKRARVTKR
jgi:DNA-binding Xre family transcriptional regulator